MIMSDARDQRYSILLVYELARSKCNIALADGRGHKAFRMQSFPLIIRYPISIENDTSMKLIMSDLVASYILFIFNFHLSFISTLLLLVMISELYTLVTIGKHVFVAIFLTFFVLFPTFL